MCVCVFCACEPHKIKALHVDKSHMSKVMNKHKSSKIFMRKIQHKLINKIRKKKWNHTKRALKTMLGRSSIIIIILQLVTRSKYM